MGQLLALQVPPWQEPLTQVWPLLVLHVWQMLPALPQLVFVVPEVQSPLFASTQPLQAVHSPATQVCFEEQLAHAAPPLPHCTVFVRLMHALPEQQPSGQLVALHEPVPASGAAVGTHTPSAVHCSLALQATHVLPVLPQLLFEVPARHTPCPSTQPSQVPPVQRPLALQVAPEMQLRQM